MMGLRESCRLGAVIPALISPEVFSTLALLPLVLLKLAGENWKISWLYKARIEITYPVVTVVYSRSFKFVLQ